MKRQSISKTARFEVFKRDKFVCQYCGAHPPAVILHVDHIIPVKEGGDNEIGNLITSCDGCNLGKGARQLNVVPESLMDRAAEIREREEQIAQYAQIVQEARDRLEADAWKVAEVLKPGASDGYRKDWLRSIKMFIEKLGVWGALDAAEIAAERQYGDRDTFKYFCGICWNKIKADDA